MMNSCFVLQQQEEEHGGGSQQAVALLLMSQQQNRKPQAQVLNELEPVYCNVKNLANIEEGAIFDFILL
jgi:hypothetical protein